MAVLRRAHAGGRCAVPLDRADQARKFTKEIHLLTHIGNCPVYTFTPLADVFHGKAMRWRKRQKDGHLPCLKNSIFYMHIQRTLFYGHEGAGALPMFPHAG
jgi:hypothetical protein